MNPDETIPPSAPDTIPCLPPTEIESIEPRHLFDLPPIDWSQFASDDLDE